MSVINRFLGVLLTVIFCPSIICAQDSVVGHIKIDEIIISGNILEKSSEFSLKIDSTIMDRHKGESLSELLSQNTNVFVKTSGRNSEAYASMRGTAPSHTAVYWNSLKINSPQRGMVDLSQIPMFLVDNAEINSGITSLRHGNGGLGGAIVLDNLPRFGKGLHAGISQSVGSFDTYDTYFDISYSGRSFVNKSKLFYSASDNDFKFRNHDILDPDRPGYVPIQRNKSADYHKWGFMEEIHTRLSDNKTLSFMLWGVDNKRNLPQLSTYEGAEHANLSSQQEQSLRSAIKYKYYTKYVDLEAIVGFQDVGSDFLVKHRITNGYNISIDSKSKEKSLSSDINVIIITSKTSELKGSLSAVYSDVSSVDRVSHNGVEASRGEYSLFLSSEKLWSERFLQSLSLRSTLVEGDFKSMPLLYFNYLLTPSFSVNFGGGLNYRYPSLSDLKFMPGGNPDLKPENGYTFEAGLKYSKNTMNVTLNGYFSRIDNWILWLPSIKQFWQPENVKLVESSGLELSVNERFYFSGFNLYVNSSFNLSRSINKDAGDDWAEEAKGKQLVYIPKFSANAFAKIERNNCYFTYQISYYGERYMTSSNDKDFVYSRLEPYFMNDCSVGCNLRFDKFLFSTEFRVNNLFNADYMAVFQRPEPMRNYQLNLKLAF